MGYKGNSPSEWGTKKLFAFNTGLKLALSRLFQKEMNNADSEDNILDYLQ